MKYCSFFLFLLTAASIATAQPFATWKGSRLILDNGIVKREIRAEHGKIITTVLWLKGSSLNFDTAGAGEFSLVINGRKYDGSSGWRLNSFKEATDAHSGNGAMVQLEGTGELKNISVKITYLLYPELPVIRKQITVVNKTAGEVRLESLDIEKLQLGFSYVESVCFANYGRQKHLGTYIGNWDDPLLAIHSYAANAGILLGNEAPGVLKRTDYNTVKDNADIGLTHSGDTYPFRKYIRSGQSWISPRVFVIPYANASGPWTAMNNELSAFERKHMGLQIFEQKNRPVFMYNNYRPFGSHLSDTLLITLAKAAAQSGIRQFEVDCGWYTTTGAMDKKLEWIANTGDWITDKKKFPHGLEPVFDSIRRLGMEPGLWISLGSAASSSKVFKEHPGWRTLDKNLKPANMHDMSDFDLYTMCMGTEWKDYTRDKILQLVKSLDLKIVKLDLTVLTSAYVLNTDKSGCYAVNHPFHKDRAESFIVIYNRLFELFDELHKEVPGLYIDCTFETEGKLQLIDYAFLEHAEANWLTNISEPYPVGAYRVRDLTWWKSPVVPSSSLLIGNLTMDSPDFISELKTLVGSVPLVLGDPRSLSPEKRAEIKQWADWLVVMQHTYQYDLYRQDLHGFGEPVEGGWDGWSRINVDTKAGGIVGVFRQGSPDEMRNVSVAGLDMNAQYLIKLAPSGTVLLKTSGWDLQEKGFQVRMDKQYDSKLFEVQLEGLSK